jgi:general secretion pathway protein G
MTDNTKFQKWIIAIGAAILALLLFDTLTDPLFREKIWCLGQNVVLVSNRIRNYERITDKVGSANDIAARASLRAVEAAVQSYEMDSLQLPTSLTDLTIQKDGNGPYLKPNELSDPWGCPFVYAKPGSHGIGFDLSCKSPSGKVFCNWD